MKNNKLIITLIIVLVVFIAAAGWLLWKLKANAPEGPSEYSAVYLSTGDIYYGKLHWFPRPYLTDAWFLQQGIDEQNQPAASVNKFTNVFWGPTDKIKLNSDQIVWTATLKNNSQLVEAFQDPSVLRQGQQPAPNFQGPTGSPSVEGPTGQPPGSGE